MKTNKRAASLCMAASMAASTLIGVIPATAVYADDWQTAVYKADEFYATLSPDADKQGEIVTVDQTGQLWQYGYYNDEVGYQSFNNMFYGENLWQMTQDAPSGSAANWDYGDYALPGRYIYPAVQYDSAVTFNAPMEGTVTIASTGAWVGGGSTDGIRIAIYAGDTRIWPTDSEWCDINSTNGNSVTVPEITVALHKGEPLHFRLNCNGNATGDMSCWYPQLSYMSLQYLQQYAPGAEQSSLVFSAKGDYTVPTEESGVVKIDQTGKTWQYGYYSESEGYQPFNTQYFADGVWRMTTDSEGGPNWGYGVYSTDTQIYPAGSRDNAVTFTAPIEGTVSVTAENNNAWVDGATTDGIQIAIYAGDTKVWPTDSDWCVLNSSNGNSVTIPEVKVALHKDEQLHFRINCGGSSQNDRTFWYPTVTYISEEYQDQYAPGYVPEPETGDVYPFQISATQGENGWYYLYAEIGQDLLNFQPAFISDWWWTAQDDFTTGIVRSEGLHPGEYDAILGFKAPYTGKIKISFAGDKVESKESCAGDDGIKFGVYSSTDDGTRMLYPTNGEMLLVKNKTSETIKPFTVNVKKNELILFRANKNGNAWCDMLNCVPTITYLSEDKDDMGYDDPFANDSGEKEAYTVGADTTKIPAAPGTENAQPITADELKKLLADGSASGVYALDEPLIFDAAYNGQEITMDNVVLTTSASPAVQVTASNFVMKNAAIVTSGDTALTLANVENVQVQASYLSAQKNAISLTGSKSVRIVNSNVAGAVQTDAMQDLNVENNILNGTFATAAQDSTIAHNNIAGAVTISGKENVILYANKLENSVSFQNSNNGVVLKNDFAAAANVSAENTNNISVAENTFACSGAAASLDNAEIALITGNTYKGSTTAVAGICTAKNCGKVYGDNIPGKLDGTDHAGADESKLPADRTKVFADMETKTTVNYNGSTVSVNAYLRQAARKQQDVVLQPGVYSVDAITFANIKDMNLYGYGVLLVFNSYTQKAIAMTGCENVSVKGITMDHAHVANAQGTVISVDGDTVVWKPDDGYGFDLLDTNYFNRDAAATAFRKGSKLPYADVSFNTNRVKNSDGTYTLTGTNTLQAGDRIMFRGAFCDVNNLYNCNYVTYEDVTVWNGSGFAIRELEGEGNTILNRMAVTPGPKPTGATEERMISTCDATHSTNIRKGFTVKNCLFENMNDDGSNVNSTYGNVTGFDTATKTLTFQATTPYNTTAGTIRKGDTIRIMTNDGKLLLDTKAVADGAGNTAVLSDSFTMPENTTVLVQNLSATGNGFSYENVVVRNNRSRGLLIRSVDGSIINCTLENNGMAGILITGTLKDVFCESGFANNVTVRKNLIRGNGYYGSSKEYSAIAITSDSATSGDPDCQNHTNIVIEGNVFEDRYSDNAISVESAKNVKIFNNTFKARSSAVNSDAPKDTVAPIRMTGSTDIEVSGNQYPDGTVVRAMLSSTVVNAYGTDLGKMSSEVVSSELSTCRENGKWSVKVTLKNLTDEVQKGTWKTVSPLEMFGKELTGDFELLPGETKSYTIPVGKTALQLADPDDLADVTVAHCVTGRDYSYNTASLSFASAQKTDKAIIIDGTASEDAWTTAEPMFLNRVNQTSVLAGWKGIDDLSAEVRFLWDAQNLYFYVEVTDDVHSQPKSDDTIWLGDSIQMAFSPDGSANYAEMTWALGNDGKVYSYCGNNTIPKKGRSAGNAIAGGSCVIRRDEDANKTYYEASIPWAFIGINGEAPEDGTAIRMAMLVNDDDGAGRRGYMNIFDGIGQGKYPAKYGAMYMSALPSAEQPEQPGKPENSSNPGGDNKGDTPAQNPNNPNTPNGNGGTNTSGSSNNTSSGSSQSNGNTAQSGGTASSTASKAQSSAKIPSTSDSAQIALWVYLMLGSLVGAAALTFLHWKKRFNK